MSGHGGANSGWGYYKFDSQNSHKHPNYRFSTQCNQGNETNKRFSSQQNYQGASNYGLNYQGSWQNQTSNSNPNNLIEQGSSYDTYYGMATNDPGVNYESNTDNRPSFNNVPKGNNKKGKKRPLPDDPKERKRIKNNNRGNKKSNMAGGKTCLFNKPQLIEKAAKNAPAGVDVFSLSKKQLKMLAGGVPNSHKEKALDQFSKTLLMQIAAKHVSEKVNIKSFTKKGLKSFIRQVDPDYKPADGTSIKPPVSKKGLRKFTAGERNAAALMMANKMAEIPIDEDENDELTNPIKIMETVSMRKENFQTSGKKRKKCVKENRKFNPKTIKSMYNELKANQALDYNGIALAGFLRHALFEIFKEKRVHCLMLAEYVLGHPNVLKLLQYEVGNLVNIKFMNDPDASQKKRALLLSVKAEVLEDDEHFFQDSKQAYRAWLMDGCIDILAASVYPLELIPTPRDYMRDSSNIPSHEESVTEYQLLFITYMYETLGFVITDTLSTAERIKFHLDNAIIPAMLVEFVRSFDTYVVTNPFHMYKVKPGDQLALPSAISNSITRKNIIGYCRNPQSGKLYSELKTNNLQLQTKVMEVLPDNVKPGTTLLRNFANLILFSDEFFSLTRFKLIEHTPYLVLTREEKIEIFNALLKKIYKEAYVIWERKLTIHDMTFAKDEIKEHFVE